MGHQTQIKSSPNATGPTLGSKLGGWRRLWTTVLGVIAGLFVLTAVAAPTVALADDAPAAPAHEKTLVDNGDGTYTLSLSVTGSSSSETTSSKANVIIIMDLSGSMNYTTTSYAYSESSRGRYGTTDGGQTYVTLYRRYSVFGASWYEELESDNYSGTVYVRNGNSYTAYTGTRYTRSSTNSTRLAVAKAAVNSLIESLNANNTSENPDNVEISLVTFSNYANTNSSYYNRWYTGSNMSSLETTVNNLSATGGTNWDDALHDALTVANQKAAAQPDETTHIIFVSDGNPTYYMNSNHSTRYGNGSDTTTDVLNAAYAEADAIRSAGYSFYAVGAFGDASNMETIATRGSGSYYDATDQTALNAAFAEISNAVTSGVGYSDVVITDGITSMTSTMLVNADPNSFTYTVTDSQGNPVTVADLPEASYTDGTVGWDLSALGTLQNGWTYTVSFHVWPSQEAYDLVAALNNGTVSYDDLSEEEKYQIVEVNGAYALRTNTESSINSNQVETITTTKRPDGWTQDGDEVDGYTYTYDSTSNTYTGTKVTPTAPDSFTNPDPMPLVDTVASIHKEWVNDIDSDPSVEVSVSAYRDGETDAYWTGTLNEGDDWTASVDLSAGVMTDDGNGNVEILETGHDFWLDEDIDGDYHWEFTARVVRPMVLNGELVLLQKVDAATEDSYEIEGGYYVVADAANASVWTVSNYRRSDLNLTKVVNDKTNGSAPSDATFTYEVTVNDAEGADVWFSIRDAGNNAITTGISGATAQDGGYFSVASGTTFTVQMQAGWNLRAINLLSGSSYTITETSMPAGFEFASVSAENGAVDSTSGATISGNVDAANEHVVVTYTNDFDSVVVGDDTDVSISAVKTVTGYDAREAFSFQLIPSVEKGTQAAIDDGRIVVSDGALTASTSEGMTNGASQTVTFGNITFLAEGEYTFTIDETTTTDAAGWTYDASAYEVTVKVQKNNEGRLTASVSYDTVSETAPVFTNSYEAASVEASIPVTKVLSGRDWKDGDSFEFTLTAVDNAPMPSDSSVTITNETTDQTASFGSITYTEAGTYTYKVTETAGSLGGVSYDTSEKTVIVTVTDDGSGQLSASVAYADEVSSFVNTYSAAPTEATIQATKAISGRDWQDGDSFTFVLAAVDGAPEPSNDTVTITNETEDYTAAFGTIEFTEAGTYYYTVTEVEGDLGGVSYDTSAKTIIVRVTDDGKGQLEASVDYGSEDASSVVVENTYDADSTQATIQVSKELSGRDWLDTDSFEFTLTAVDGAPMPASDTVVINNLSAGYAAFDSITYDAVGTYEYTISEVAGSISGITYDEDSVAVTVTVTDNGQGYLVASVAYDGNAEATSAAFQNTYKAASTEAQITVFKTLTGREWKDGDVFYFELTADEGAPLPSDNSLEIDSTTEDHAASFDAITFDEAGTYTYHVNEVEGSLGGVAYDTSEKTVTVTVTDDGSGQLSASVNYGDAESAEFVNTYSASSDEAEIIVSKTLTGREWKDGDVFEFTLSADEGVPMPESSVVTIDNSTEGHAASFGAITYTEAGSYEYTITETEGDLGGVSYVTTPKTVTVNVTDNGEGQLEASVDYGDAESVEFENTYEAASTEATIQVAKEISGRDWQEGDSFEFTLTALNGAPMPSSGSTVTITNGTEGHTTTFGAITFDEAGTYTYEIRETQGNLGGMTYDDSVKTVTITVGDDGDGQLYASVDPEGVTFTNTYEASEGTLAGFSVTKVLTGRDWTNSDEFTFVLTADEGTPMPASTTAVASEATNHVATFGQITYDQVGTYTYTVREDTSSLPGGVTAANPDAVATVTVTVTDNGQGSLVATAIVENGTFTNVYKASSTTVSIPVAKSLTGRDWTSSDAFTFELSAVNGAPMPEGAGSTATVGSGSANHTSTFGAITYTEAGVYTYNVTEVNNGLGGVSYDDSVQTVTVTVADDGQGQLVATPSSTTDSPVTFSNTYTAQPTTVTVTGTKTLTNRALAAGEFSFELYQVDAYGNRTGYSTTVTNDASGNINFGTLTFSEAGTYYYIAEENTAGLPSGVTATKSSDSFTVVVTDDGNGNLVANQSSFSLSFENTYGSDAQTSVKITGTKLIATASGDNAPVLQGGEYTFTLTGEGVNETVTNDASGAVTFPEITYTIDDLLDSDGNNLGSRTFYYEVTEAGSLAGVANEGGTKYLQVTVTDNGDGTISATSPEPFVFTNTYSVTPTTSSVTSQLTVSKTLTGRSISDGEFSFQMTDGQNNVVATGTSDASGSVAMSSITFDTPGTYVYQLSEVEGSAGGVTYDSASHEVRAVVTDQGDGTLAVTWATDSESLSFSNTYEAAPTSVTLAATKVLTGRELAEGEFTFELRQGDDVIQTVSNAADGTISFDTLTFDEAGTYVYTVSEVAGNAQRVTYDDTVTTVTIEVTDDGEGSLHATVTMGDSLSGIVFTNVYTDPKPATIDPPIKKVISGETPAQDAVFTFTMTANDPAAPMPEGSVGGTKTVTITGAGSTEFGVMTYTDADLGTWTYTLSEVDGGVSGYAYDKTTYTMTVVVSLDDNGDVQTEVSYADAKGNSVEEVVFDNAYSTSPARTTVTRVVRTVRSALPKTGDASVALSIVELVAAGGALVTGGKVLRKRDE